MIFLLITIILFFPFEGAMAQINELPSNPEPGKCYIRCFYYDKPIQWEEIDCGKIKKSRENIKNGFAFEKIVELKLKLLEYQKKLISLGYKLLANGSLDNQTIKAHNKYLYLKIKEARIEKLRNRRK